MKTQNEQYRFDNSYENVYEFNGSDYEYICNYHSSDIKPRDSKAIKIRKIEEWEAGGFGS